MGAHSDPTTSHASSTTATTNSNCENGTGSDDISPAVDGAGGFHLPDQPMGTKRPVKVVLMGAGASSLNFFKKAEEQMQNLQIVCYEKNHDVGGTWLENRYPGCACDIPSVNYQFTWKTVTWSHYYSYSPEIWRYLKEIEQENDFITKYIKLRHRIERAEWDDDAGLWRFKIRNIETGQVLDDAAEFFLNAGGVLNSWKWPDVPGLHDFRGKLMHSANYEEGYELRGKKVAVIGAGSSGVQIVAAIQPHVQQLYHWIKSPIWITPGFGQRWAGRDGANFRYTPEQLEFLQQNPQKYLSYRKQVESELNQRFKFILNGSPEQKLARETAEADMRRRLHSNPSLADKMIPKNFYVGCRRPTPAPGYLDSLTQDNVTVYTDPVEKITASGFIDHEGEAKDVDVIICATGFDTSWIPPFPLIAYGKDLRDIWRSSSSSSGSSESTTTTSPPSTTHHNPPHSQGILSYLSISIPNFPNYFTFCGPYGPVGHGSFLPLVEQWTQYMLSVITKVQIEGIKSLRPAEKPARDFTRHADAFLKRTAWTGGCSSWFKQGTTSAPPTIYPGSRLHFLQLLSSPRYEDYHIEYLDENMFSFLGNGFEVREFDGRDITYYLGLLEPGVQTQTQKKDEDQGQGQEEGKRDVQPNYDDELLNRMAGWTVGEEYEVRGGL